MSRDHVDELRSRAREFLEAAEDSRAKARYNAAYDDARQATELACKAILQREDGEYPKQHQVAGRMYERGLIPSQVTPKDLSRLLGDYNRGRYGFEDPVTEAEAGDALRLARTLLESAGGR